jgi:hypothetical protein
VRFADLLSESYLGLSPISGSSGRGIKSVANDTPAALAKAHTNAEQSELLSSRRFLGGTLYQVRVAGGNVKVPYNVLVYDDGRMQRPFGNLQEMATFVSDAGLSQRRPSELLTIPGIIAIAITITLIIIIIYQIIHGLDVKVPEILGGAITTILGFYFGRYTAERQKEPNEAAHRS